MSVAGTEEILQKLYDNLKEEEKRKKKEEYKKTHPNILICFLSSVVFTLLFFVLHIFLIFIVSYLLVLLAKVPVLSFLIAAPIRQGTDPNLFVLITSAYLASLPVMYLLDKAHKHRPNYSLSCKMIGVYMIVFWLACFIINLINKDFVFQNLVMSGMGLLMFEIANDG